MFKNTGLNPRACSTENFPSWDKPKALSCFNINSERFYESDCTNLRYFKIPKELPLNLDIGVEFAKKKPESDEGLDHVLEHIMNTYAELIMSINNNNVNTLHLQQKPKTPLIPVEFVGWRGLLRLIMCTPFDDADWIIDVTRFKGTYYMCERETEAARLKRLYATNLEKRSYSWGYKFGQYCLTKSPQSAPETNAAVDECSELVCVFHTRLAGLNLLYGAEVEGVISNKIINDINRELQTGNIEFVQLKTAIQNMNDKQMNEFQSKITRNWWCQSFLVGIEDVIVGWRDGQGCVQDIETIKVNELPIQNKLQLSHCAQFLVNFLNCIKNVMPNVDCPYTVYEFRYDAKNLHIEYNKFEGLTERSILPDYYIHFLERHSKTKK